MNKFFVYLLLIFFTTALHSCLNYKQIVNFQDGSELKDGIKDSIKNYTEIKLQPDDILLINVFSFNTVEANRFNAIAIDRQAMNASMGSGSGANEPIGYIVDRDGFLHLPVIGKIKAQGLTISELQQLVYKKIEETKYLNEFSVEVRFLSFRVTVLGEVNAPGTYIITNRKLTILEALGLARDLTLFSNRDNILVVREEDGIRKYGRLNLKSKSVFQSPYFYLKPNDIIYVEPHQTRVLTAPDPATRYINTILGVVSLATLIITLSK
jgi:polysaccharide export outer membrane protein